MRTSKKKHFNPFVSSWVAIGISIVLMSIVVFQAAMNYNREKKHMGKLLKEKGAALIRSFEAGAKTGMMGMMGNTANMQILILTLILMLTQTLILMLIPSTVNNI